MHDALEDQRCAALRPPARQAHVPSRKRHRPSLTLGAPAPSPHAYTYDNIPLRATAPGSAKRIMVLDVPQGHVDAAPAPRGVLQAILSRYRLPRPRDAQLHLFPSELETRGLRVQMLPGKYREDQFGQILFLCGADPQHVPFAMVRRYGSENGAGTDLYAYIEDDTHYAHLMRAWPALWTQLLSVGAALCSGLDKNAATYQAIIHNDVKPENLVVQTWDAAGGRVHLRLIDFDHAWPLDARVQGRVSYGCARLSPPPPDTLCITDRHIGCTPAYAAPPLQPAFRGLGLRWNAQGVDAWSLANTAYFAFTRALLTPRTAAELRGMGDDEVSLAPCFMVLEEVLHQMDEATRLRVEADAARVVRWDGFLAGDRIPQMASAEEAAGASALITLEDVNAALARHAQSLGNTPQARRAARDVGLLFELCSLTALHRPDLRAAHADFARAPPEDPLLALVERLRLARRAQASVADDNTGAFSVWDVLLMR